MSNEDAVRQASQRFYAALNEMANGDAGSMSGVWSHSAHVTTMHPIGGMEVGWEQVAEPWKQVSALAANGQVTLADQHIHAADDMAVEVGTERGAFDLGGKHVTFEHRVTNAYRREGGEWKIVHHHTDLSPAMIDVISSLLPG